MFLIVTETGMRPPDFVGMSDGQIDWMYYGLVDKFRKEAEVFKGTQDSISFSAL